MVPPKLLAMGADSNDSASVCRYCLEGEGLICGQAGRDQGSGTPDNTGMEKMVDINRFGPPESWFWVQKFGQKYDEFLIVEDTPFRDTSTCKPCKCRSSENFRVDDSALPRGSAGLCMPWFCWSSCELPGLFGC